MRAPAFVIGLAAPPGGGKTTVSGLVAERLGHAPVVHYDDYETMTRRPPAEIEAWLARGAPPDEITAPGFAEAIARRRTDGARHLVVDGPLGRAHAASGAMIDLLVFIDTPFDIALARVIHGEARRAAGPADARGFVAWLDAYLDNYQRFARRSYQLQRDIVMPGADLVLDGALTPPDLADRVLRAVAERVGP